jgi:TonB family protein
VFVAPIKPAGTEKIKGTVVLTVILSEDGAVKEVQPKSGPAPLIDAAASAVKQWRYKPTRLDGEAAEVQTTFSLTFKGKPGSKATEADNEESSK